MNELSSADLAFRDEVRSFLDRALTAGLRAESARQSGVFADGDLCRRWHRILYEQGWVAPSWPKEYGGPGWNPMQRFIFADECARANAPVLPAMGLQMCGPVLMGHGTPEQKAYFLPRILSGEHYWCQGYSEPQSGSDLASLQTRAVRDGDEYVVSGSKIWTTHAQHANWMFLLARTSTEGRPQAGISFLLTPMDAPGISVRPIISISGEHEINQVFFDEVRIPAKNRVGAENNGWAVAKYLLEFERGAGASAGRMKVALERVRRIARTEAGGGGGSFWDESPAFRARWSEIDIQLEAIRHAERQVAVVLAAGREIGDTIASRLKLTVSSTTQAITELAVEAIGHYAAPFQRAAVAHGANDPVIGPEHALTPTARYLNTRAATIYGGSQEIQHNILARILLAA